MGANHRGHHRAHDHHEHLDAPDDTPLEDNPIWQQDNVSLCSVGMDIGSAGTQVVFSRLHLRRHGEDLTSRYHVVERTILYRSPVALTPYRSDDLVDADAVVTIVDGAYHRAGISPAEVDTGVVILTGEALRRPNARRISDVLARHGGDLVCATAGHHLEARMAAMGSGAAHASHAHGTRVLNVDIGGGTTKLAVCDRGEVVATATLHIGGRLVVVDDDRIVRLEPAGRDHARRAGLDWSMGTRVDDGDLARVAAAMADMVIAAIQPGPWPDEVTAVLLTAPIARDDIDELQLSGGVAEYVHDRESRALGDLGPHLGQALRARLRGLPQRLLPAGEPIRATVLGASQHSVQLSGQTSWIPNPELVLPRRSLRVVRPDHEPNGDMDPGVIASAIRARLTAFEVPGDEEIALAMAFAGAPTHRRLLGLARGIAKGLSDRVMNGAPLYLVVDGDIGLTLGRVLRDEVGLANEVVVLDGLDLWDFDYVDLGRLRQPSRTVPVTIKSLVFEQDWTPTASASEPVAPAAMSAPRQP